MNCSNAGVRFLAATSLISLFGCGDGKPEMGEKVILPHVQISRAEAISVALPQALAWEDTPEATKQRLEKAGFTVTMTDKPTLIFSGTAEGVSHLILVEGFVTELSAKKATRNDYAERAHVVTVQFLDGKVTQVIDKTDIEMFEADLTDKSLDPFGNSQSIFKVAAQQNSSELDRGKVNDWLRPIGFALPEGSAGGRDEKCVTAQNERLEDDRCASGVLVSYSAYSERNSGPIRRCEQGPCSVAMFLEARGLQAKIWQQASEIGRKAFVEKFGEPDPEPLPEATKQ